MARKRTGKPRFFFEPWRASKSPSHGLAPNVDGLPEDAAASILDAWGRSDRDADWILWGSKMQEPAIAKGYGTGVGQIIGDERIIAIRRWLGLPEGSPTNEEVAKRIVDCVNAMAGIADPVAYMEDVRALLLGYLKGECDGDPRSDVRIVSLVGRCIPIEEWETSEWGSMSV